MSDISKLSDVMKPVQYGKWTLGNVTSMLKKVDKPPDFKFDVAEFHSPTPQEIRSSARWRFTTSNWFRTPELNALTESINAERDQAINDFYDGRLSADGLADKFQELLARYRDGHNENLPLGIDLYAEEAMTEVFYSNFRASALNIAVERNNAEGRQYITGKIDTQRNWKYYNSDYYFQSEDALEAITRGLTQYLDVRKAEPSSGNMPAFDIDIPDYKAEGMDESYNFNSAWSAYFVDVSWRGGAGQFMRDYDQVPPKDFQWFYQSGGDAKARKFYVTWDNLDGKDKNIPFNHKDPFSATTWASYVDSKGVKHYVNTDFSYDHTENDLKIVSSLLRFTGNKKEDGAYNKFLSSLQVSPKGHFERFGLIKPIELRRQR